MFLFIYWKKSLYLLNIKKNGTLAVTTHLVVVQPLYSIHEVKESDIFIIEYFTLLEIYEIFFSNFDMRQQKKVIIQCTIQ